MKKIITAFLILAVVVLASGCSSTETSREPIDRRYTKPYTSIETEMEYHFDIFRFEMVYVPITRSVDHAAKYEVLYRVTYADGHQTKVWEEVDEQTYKQFTERT